VSAAEIFQESFTGLHRYTDQ